MVAEDKAAVESKVKVKKALLAKAVRALVEVVAKKSANSNPLFGETSETMCLYFTLSKIPDKRKLKPVMIPLPHPLYDDKSEICFLSKDPQKEYKELLLRKHPVPGITKVIGVDKLRRNYKTPEQKRQLADAFDLFLCDISIMDMMMKVLGRVFMKNKKKNPIPVRLRKADPVPNLKTVLTGTPLRIPSGPCLTIKIGRVSMDVDALVANAAVVIAHTVRHLEQQDNPVQSITVKTTDSPALPIWRRPRPGGEFLDLKKYHSDASSSAASDTAGSAVDTVPTSDSEIASDAGETLPSLPSTPLSELPSGAETMSELDSLSEMDSEAGDVDASSTPVGQMPLVRSLKGKKRKAAGLATAISPRLSAKVSPKMSPKAPPKAAASAGVGMPPPPAKKTKKSKA